MIKRKQGKISILLIFLVIALTFSTTILVLSFLGLTPKTFQFFANKKVNSNIIENVNDVIDINSEFYTRPDQIIIDKVGINTIVNKPETADVSVLDQSLLSGAVHYPGSGSIERGNMLVFGHSTNWKVVQNQAYKTFNNLDKLQKGNEIKVIVNNKTYIYKVTSVILIDEKDALVVFDSSQRKLTLSTCDTFGRKQDRWVVEADFYSEA